MRWRAANPRIWAKTFIGICSIKIETDHPILPIKNASSSEIGPRLSTNCSVLTSILCIIVSKMLVSRASLFTGLILECFRGRG